MINLSRYQPIQPIDLNALPETGADAPVVMGPITPPEPEAEPNGHHQSLRLNLSDRRTPEPEAEAEVMGPTTAPEPEPEVMGPNTPEPEA